MKYKPEHKFDRPTSVIVLAGSVLMALVITIYDIFNTLSNCY